MAAKLKPYRKALSIMGKMGVAMAVTPKAEGDAANDEADSED